MQVHQSREAGSSGAAYELLSGSRVTVLLLLLPTPKLLVQRMKICG